MKYSTSKVGMVVLSILSATVVTACSTPTGPYRSYNLDASCHYYYVDGMGQKVYDGGYYTDEALVGLPLHQDASGRWYYQDSVGNRLYKSTRC